jgi:DNA-binding response OmpR family regulator
MRILVVEPHAEVRALLGHVVERLGHEAVFLPSGRDGEVLPDGDIDVLLLEPAAPSARTAAEHLCRRRALPVVCASIYPDVEPPAGVRPLAYLIKPFGLVELERALRAAVQSVAQPARLAS